MKVLEVRNVAEALPAGLALLRADGVWQDSRAGRVLVMPCPVTTAYANPLERVLTCPNRRANVWFHLFESLWMLDGRNDATWLDQFVSDFSARFAEEGGRQHGAYGFRWRQHFDMEGGGSPVLPDQLETIVGLLQKNPDDRRIVLQMWDPVADLSADVKDVPCNTQAYFRVHAGRLDMTVCNRSNDVVWGAYGANAFHFSVLMEYVAAALGVEVGTYYQVSNNYHVYEDILQKLEGSLDDGGAYRSGLGSRQLVDDAPSFLSELEDWLQDPSYVEPEMRNQWFNEVGVPMYLAWINRRDSALFSEHLSSVKCDALRAGAIAWKR